MDAQHWRREKRWRKVGLVAAKDGGVAVVALSLACDVACAVGVMGYSRAKHQDGGRG